MLVAMADRHDLETLEHLRRKSGRPLRVVVSTWPEIELALDATFQPVGFKKTLRRNLACLLHSLGFINAGQYSEICRIEETENDQLDEVLVEKSGLDEASVAEAKSLLFYAPWVRLESHRVNTELAPIVPRHLAEQFAVIPLYVERNSLVIAGPDLLLRDELTELRKATGMPVYQVICTRSAFKSAFQEAYDNLPTPREVKRISLEEALVKRDLIAPQELRWSLSIRQATGEPLEEVLLRLGYLDEDQLLDAKAFQLGYPGVRLGTRRISMSLAGLLPEACSRRYACLPFASDGNVVSVAMVNPLDTDAIQILSQLTGAIIKPFLCFEQDLELARGRVYGNGETLGANIVSTFGEPNSAHGPLKLAVPRQATHMPPVDTVDRQLALPRIHLERYHLHLDTILLIPEETAKEHCLLAVYRQDDVLTVAVADPNNEAGIAEVERVTGLAVRAVLTSRQAIIDAVDEQYAAASIDVPPEIRDFTNYLVQQGALQQDQVREVWISTARGVPIDLAVIGLGTLSDEQVAIALAQHQHLEYIDLSPSTEFVTVLDAVGQPVQKPRQVDPVDRKIARLIGAETATAITAIPIGVGSHSDSLTVAFANPLDQAAIEAVKKLSQPYAPVVSTRQQVLDAIRRALGKVSIGDYLVRAGIITPKQQAEALQLHRKTGVRMGKALTSLGHITDEQLVTLLARQQQIAFYDLTAMSIDQEIIRMLPEQFEREHRLIPIEVNDQSITIAMVDSLNRDALQEVESMTHLQVHFVLTTDAAFARIMDEVYRGDYLKRSSSELVFRYPDESAFQVLSTAQTVSILVFLAASAMLVAWNYLFYFILLNSLATLFYVSSSVYKLYLIYRSLTHTLEVPITDEEVAAVDERELPVYSILVPLYRESRIVPRLIRAIDNLDYPKAKLDVKILLEEDDGETIEAIRQYSLPSHFKLVVVPEGQPKGKPKACNYGLIHAEGKYVVIFDAEDIPEPDQLKKAIVAFQKADESVACVQAKLNYYNRDQNLLTRWFTAEYSMWFDLLLPGLDADDVPIPLGGTSNHFPTEVLQGLGAWDPHNVTEDADLGMRLYKAGWRTAVIDSTTYEEANSQVYNWIRQRSRWVKGYVQTYLVHMRHPYRLWRYVGTKAFFSFNMVIGGTFLSFLLNPLYWCLTALWFLTQWSLIRELYPPIIFYIGGFGLYVGNFVFTYVSVAGCLRRGYYDMVKYALLTPIYWALMSVAAWKGFIQLFYKPSYWEKTVHGLYEGEAVTAPASGWRDLLFRRGQT